jgi:hypothetical protein
MQSAPTDDHRTAFLGGDSRLKMPRDMCRMKQGIRSLQEKRRYAIHVPWVLLARSRLKDKSIRHQANVVQYLFLIAWKPGNGSHEELVADILRADRRNYVGCSGVAREI